jgi:CxxC motif-containing protein (DUF1111 family)
MRLLILLISFLLSTHSLADSGEDVTRLGDSWSSSLPGRHTLQVPAPSILDQGRRGISLSGFSIFHSSLTPTDGIGPNFVNNSCGGCHVENGKGGGTLRSKVNQFSAMVLKFALPNDEVFQAQPHQVSKNKNTAGERLSVKWRLVKGTYKDGTKYTLRRPAVTFRTPKVKGRVKTSLRMTPAIIGAGLLEAIDEQTLAQFADPNDADGNGISGRINMVPVAGSGSPLAPGRFGFKGSHTSIEQQSLAALFFDMGITNYLFREGDTPYEFPDSKIEPLVLYQGLTGVPFARNQSDPAVQAGFKTFKSTGCHECHRFNIPTGDRSGVTEARGQVIHPFTDLLLHDMGLELGDRVNEFEASGREWRTTPLWGLGFLESVSNVRPAYLHDGRARSIEEAILWHGGEGSRSRDGFKALSKGERDNLIKFLRSL